MKQYLGIIISVIYALAIRLLGEMDVIEINSISFLLVTPMIIGFIPFFLKQDAFLQSTFKVITFPLISVVLFLLIAVISRLEDIACFIIIGFPYVLISAAVSLLIRSFLKDKNKGLNKNAFPIFMLPILLGMMEKQLPKQKTELTISNEIIINSDKQNIWNNLLDVPDLRNERESSLINYIGIPRPIKSSYDANTNIRLGYFENGIILNESIVESVDLKKMVFKINLENSSIQDSPTLEHVLKNKNIEFENISYILSAIDKNQTNLKLSTRYTIHTNLSFYGKFWSQLIIEDFEANLLHSLKSAIEKSAK